MLDDALLESTARAIRDSDFEGWVCYVDNMPILEAVPHQPKLASLAPGARVLPVRPADRNTREWKALPHERVHRLELYFARDHYANQPVIRIDRQPGNPEMRFLQMKMGGITVGAGAGAGAIETGQRRLGVTGYRVGFWNPKAADLIYSKLIEVTRQGTRDLGTRPHPCWPEPWGFGLAPWVIGLTPEQVPPAPGLLNSRVS